MADPPAPCRWGAMSVLMRLKNIIKGKVFWYRILNEPDFPDDVSEADPRQWIDTQQQCDYEGSTSNHPGYFDAPQGFHTPSSQFGQSEGLFSQMLYGEEMMWDPSHEQEAFITLPDFSIENQQHHWGAQEGLAHSASQPIYAQYGCAEEEFADARAEMQDDQASLQHGYSAPPDLGHYLSTMEMMDTGDSSTLGPVPQSSAAEWQRILFIRQFLGVDGVVRAGPGWNVVLGIVSVFKKISGLIQRRRQQRVAEEGQTSTQITPRRMYRGIRQRGGKWVSEIRIGGTQEKVWLGSYNTEKEAALAFDAGHHHCCLKRAKGFNFADSPRLLGVPQSFAHLSSTERRAKVKELAEDHARAYGSADIR